MYIEKWRIYVSNLMFPRKNYLQLTKESSERLVIRCLRHLVYMN